MEQSALRATNKPLTSTCRRINAKNVLRVNQWKSISARRKKQQPICDFVELMFQYNFISQQIEQRMQDLMNRSEVHAVNSKMKYGEIHVNAEILRIQTVASVKQISNIWFLDQSRICDYLENYHSLPFSKVQIKELLGNLRVRIVRNENKIYIGETMNRRKHGKGITIYRDGRVYEGEFFSNQKSGSGCELYANGNLYIGQFSQNKKHGRGSFYWFSLCSPACTKTTQVKIEQYHGTWWGGLPDGQGEHQKANGDLYVGGFKNGLKHGEGVENYQNGDTYKGQFINGLPEGYGEYIWADKSLYKGDFKQGYKNGFGTWQSSNQKQQYKGHYLLDRKHGYGTCTEQSGKIYQGNYFEDHRNGHGELFEKQKMIYSGLWENGEMVERMAQTPEKIYKKTTKSSAKTQKQMSSSGVKFRINTPKQESQMVTKRTFSANIVKKKSPSRPINFTVRKQLNGENQSHHRGCVACRRRPIGGEYSQNFNPQKI